MRKHQKAYIRRTPCKQASPSFQALIRTSSHQCSTSSHAVCKINRIIKSNSDPESPLQPTNIARMGYTTHGTPSSPRPLLLSHRIHNFAPLPSKLLLYHPSRSTGPLAFTYTSPEHLPAPSNCQRASPAHPRSKSLWKNTCRWYVVWLLC